MTRTEKLLAELIALPSVNPAFAPSDGTSARQARQPHPYYWREQRVADFLAAAAARAGLEVEFQKVLPGRSNLIARLLPRNKIRQTILLAPHLDTVGADESQFVPHRKNGRLARPRRVRHERFRRRHAHRALRTGERQIASEGNGNCFRRID